MRRLFLSAMALVLGLFTVTAGFAFTFKPTAQTTWHYTGPNDENLFNERMYWQEGPGSDSCEPDEDLPCQIVGVAEEDLQALLDAHPEQEIFEIASSKAATP